MIFGEITNLTLELFYAHELALEFSFEGQLINQPQKVTLNTLPFPPPIAR